MAKLFATYKFLVGCSLDGPQEIHNHYRRTANGKSTHKDLIKGIEILKRNNVPFNILTLVSKANVDHAHEIYHYLKNSEKIQAQRKKKHKMVDKNPKSGRNDTKI